MNTPKIDPLNSLRFPLREIGDAERVDVIMTNPPFGGEEEKGIQGNFPEDKQTSETTLLFLQLIMRKLKRSTAGKKGGRCGMVVHNGTLSNPGIAIKVRGDLLRDFNLHTIVRLPKGVFSPYADIETNLLFFEHGASTKEIWFYQVPLPEGRNLYTKTKPMKFEEFDPVLKWWNNRAENSQAWKVTVDTVLENNFNLDIKNPNAAKGETSSANRKILWLALLREEQRIIALMQEIQQEIGKGWGNAEQRADWCTWARCLLIEESSSLLMNCNTAIIQARNGTTPCKRNHFFVMKLKGPSSKQRSNGCAKRAIFSSRR